MIFLCRVVSAFCSQELTGSEDLSAVTYLELRADLEEGPEAAALRDLGQRLPALEELRFSNGSRVPRIRDLGTSLARLRVLWLSRCAVQVPPLLSALSQEAARRAMLLTFYASIGPSSNPNRFANSAMQPLVERTTVRSTLIGLHTPLPPQRRCATVR